jgi:hypothetical protein
MKKRENILQMVWITQIICVFPIKWIFKSESVCDFQNSILSFIISEYVDKNRDFLSVTCYYNLHTIRNTVPMQPFCVQRCILQIEVNFTEIY